MKFDAGILLALAMLIVWGVITFVVNDAPGMTHSLLIAGVTLLIWRIVRRDAAAEAPGEQRPPR